MQRSHAEYERHGATKGKDKSATQHTYAHIFLVNLEFGAAWELISFFVSTKTEIATITGKFDSNKGRQKNTPVSV